MASWPADHVERRPVASLVPYARNPRTHSEEQVGQIAASIREWGWVSPVLVDEDGGIIAGHGRVLAAHKLGIADVPVMVAAGWSAAQKKAFVIADNQLTLNGGWNKDLLRVEIADLAEMGFDLPLIGFSEDELASLSAAPNAGLTDPDEAPEPPADPVSELGDVWLLGKHRLVCGDSTDADTVAKALNGVLPHLMVTDPPYGVEYEADWRNETGKAVDGRTVRIASGLGVRATKTRAIGKVLNDDRVDWSDAFRLFPGEVAYIWHGMRQSPVIVASLQTCGFEIRSEIIWAKTRFALSRGHYHAQHEACWYAVRGTGHWTGDRKQTTLWSIEHMKSETGHSTQKPVECMKRPIENNSSPGQAVYEPFCGSGTTIIAAEMTGRSCHAIELSPAYVDVGVSRWQSFTGEAARFEETGETFVETLARRHPNAAIKVTSDERPQAKADPSSLDRRQRRKATAQ